MNHGILTVSDTWIHQDQERYVIMDCTREDVHYAGFVKTATTEAKSAEFDAIVKEVKKAEKEAEKEAEKKRKEEEKQRRQQEGQGEGSRHGEAAGKKGKKTKDEGKGKKGKK